ncbi:hypothetical protein Q5762_00080 [Streptomyces sp. P9(2023)]|uniref:hypothetical protein n=1 Tax=Streptomyces sp. P9(2023) TaxID=3064394 RepID=UPI0028F44D1D|nr:hypothetical protein [Streptomyces sp. P9(2023)]MDT9686772.1 hypothetical protein [Streptomyces sp. P9(2023)]
MAAALVMLCPGLALAAPGDPDTSFDTDGKVTTDLGGTTDEAFAVAVQADGKIITVGRSGSRLALARHHANGSPDSSFDTDGRVTIAFGSGFSGSAMAVQADGKIVAAGLSGGQFAVARYSTNGGLDPSFDTDGKVTTSITGANDRANGMALQPDGKIVAAGGSGTGGFALARYDVNGSLDASFNADGKVTTDFGAPNDEAFAVALQADGKIIAAGRSGTDFALARYQNGTAGVDLSVTKSGPATVSLGDQASYTVTVTNTSSALQSTNVTMAGTLTGPGQLLSATPSQGTCTTTATGASCALGTLAPSTSTSATVTVEVEPTATGTLTDTATADATEPDLTPGNDTESVTTTVNNAHGCTVLGTSGANNLVGTSGNDVLCSLGGNDTVSAGNGNDTVYGGSGNDSVSGGNGTDTLNGGSGNDTISADNGADALDGEAGNDTLVGGNGADTVNGGPGNDTCVTSTGDTVTNCP